MNINLMVCAVIGAGVLMGCSGLVPVATTPALPQPAVASGSAGAIDYARIAAVEKNARYLGVQVIWLREPALR